MSELTNWEVIGAIAALAMAASVGWHLGKLLVELVLSLFE